MGNQDLASGGTKTIEDILIAMQSLATKEDLKGLATKEDLKGLATKVERLIAATPAAADIPNVYVAGKKDIAERFGSSSTWTLVKVRHHDLPKSSIPHDGGDFIFLLVSCAHCVHSVMTIN
jgi:hypothetical protein